MISYILVVICEYNFIKYKMKVSFKIFSLDKMKYLYISLLFIRITLIIGMLVNNYLVIAVLGIIINGLAYIIILLLTKDEIFLMLIKKFLLKGKSLRIRGGRNE